MEGLSTCLENWNEQIAGLNCLINPKDGEHVNPLHCFLEDSRMNVVLNKLKPIQHTLMNVSIDRAPTFVGEYFYIETTNTIGRIYFTVCHSHDDKYITCARFFRTDDGKVDYVFCDINFTEVTQWMWLNRIDFLNVSKEEYARKMKLARDLIGKNVVDHNKITATVYELMRDETLEEKVLEGTGFYRGLVVDVKSIGVCVMNVFRTSFNDKTYDFLCCNDQLFPEYDDNVNVFRKVMRSFTCLPYDIIPLTSQHLGIVEKIIVRTDRLHSFESVIMLTSIVKQQHMDEYFSTPKTFTEIDRNNVRGEIYMSRVAMVTLSDSPRSTIIKHPGEELIPCTNSITDKQQLILDLDDRIKIILPFNCSLYMWSKYNIDEMLSIKPNCLLTVDTATSSRPSLPASIVCIIPGRVNTRFSEDFMEVYLVWYRLEPNDLSVIFTFANETDVELFSTDVNQMEVAV
jgi:hypothetical protein